MKRRRTGGRDRAAIERRHGQQQRRGAVLDTMRDRIRQNGWVVTGVGETGQCTMPGCTSPHAPFDPYLYTAGLTDAGLPELLIEHTQVSVAAVILNGLALRSFTHELDPAVLHRLDELPGMSFTVTPLPADAEHHCGVARSLYGERLRILQVTPHWPGGLS